MKCAKYKLGSEPTIVLEVLDPATQQPLDIASATAVNFTFKPESGVNVTGVGALYTDGTDGKVAYTITDEELAVGRWRVEGHVVMSGTTDVYTTSQMIEVEPRLAT